MVYEFVFHSQLDILLTFTVCCVWFQLHFFFFYTKFVLSDLKMKLNKTL